MLSQAMLHMAERVSADPDFLGYWLARWCERYDRTTRDVKRELRCDADTLVHIALCGSPLRGRVVRDVTDVALKFGVDPIALAWLICLCQPTEPKRVKPITPI